MGNQIMKDSASADGVWERWLRIGFPPKHSISSSCAFVMQREKEELPLP